MVEGLKSVREVLNSQMQVEMVLATDRVENELAGFQVNFIDQLTLDSLTTLSTNESCIAVVRMPANIPSLDFNKERVIIVLDGVNDPGNLGTIIRTLDWFGYDQIICSLDTVDFYNPKTIAASMGSFSRITPHYLDLNKLFSNSDLPVYAMDMNGDSIDQVSYELPSFVVMGSEAHGIRDYLSHQITKMISIKGSGTAESLNVGIATSILLYELSRR